MCGACASLSDFCDTCRTSLWTSNRYDLLFYGNNDRGGSCIYCRTFFLERQYWTSGCKKPYLEKMVTRLVPVFPFNLQNFADGITDIRFSTYAIGSLIFMLPGTAMYTVGIAGLADKENRLLYIGIAVVLAVVVTIIGMILKKRYLKDDLEENKE